MIKEGVQISREVKERDFRCDEFKDANTKDYEIRDDGKIVRKDRWEKGIYLIASFFRFKDFEIDEVIKAVKNIQNENENLKIELQNLKNKNEVLKTENKVLKTKMKV